MTCFCETIIIVSSILPKNERWYTFMYWKLSQRSFFGRIEGTIICFRDCLTFTIIFFFSYRYKWCQSITWENFDWNKKTIRTRLIVIMCSSAKNNNCNSCICLRCQRLVMANLVTSNSPVRIVPSSPEVSRGTVISS